MACDSHRRATGRLVIKCVLEHKGDEGDEGDEGDKGDKGDLGDIGDEGELLSCELLS